MNRFAPVQLDPIEAWDLLNALNEGQNGVLGFLYSRWRTRPREGIQVTVRIDDRKIWPDYPDRYNKSFRLVKGSNSEKNVLYVDYIRLVR